ncbi:response regulator [Verrucomicrobiota bacterium]
MMTANNQRPESTSRAQKEIRKKVFLVDDHPVVRQGLHMLIEQDSELMVCGESATALDTIQQLKTLTPDILLTDISLKDSNGLELVKDIRLRNPNLPILVFSIHDETIYAERALTAGANGYVMKQEDPDLLLHAIHKVLGGDIHLSMKVTSQLLKQLSSSKPSNPLDHADAVSTLSDRELEVFELIGKGLSTRKIAEQLNLSIKTIETYRAHIKRKFNISDSAELTHRAIQWADNDS